MALNATKRKALRAVLQSSSRTKLNDLELEDIAVRLIESKTTLDDVVEKFGVSKQTLKKRLAALAEDPQPIAEA